MKRLWLLAGIIITLMVTTNFAYGQTIPGSSKSLRFVDISGHWAETSINNLANWGILNGVGEGRYLPDEYMTKCQFIAALHKALDIQIRYFRNPDITEVFNDVSNESWYSSQLYDLVVTGIVDNKLVFSPHNRINREEMAHFIMNALKYKYGVIHLSNGRDFEGFKDDNEINILYREDVLKAFNCGILQGRGGNRFEPKAAATRAEAAVVIERLMNVMKQKGEKGI